jgi:hypothetical protein
LDILCRYWKKDLWNRYFLTLLNPPSRSEDISSFFNDLEIIQSEMTKVTLPEAQQKASHVMVMKRDSSPLGSPESTF